MQKISAYFSVYMLATFKFALAPPTGYLLGLSPLEIMVTSTAGMATTAFLVPLLGEKIFAYLRKKRLEKGKTVKIFSSRKRLIIRIWQKFGIIGLSLLTPILFSPIVGCALAVSFGVKKAKIILFMSLSAIFWSALMSFGAKSIQNIFH
ncbi:MAG: small multi-drug export protein [Thermonemataceae bacterium]|nr:small multi-drug export protein [Thermonemataceae bacterium]